MTGQQTETKPLEELTRSLEGKVCRLFTSRTDPIKVGEPVTIEHLDFSPQFLLEALEKVKPKNTNAYFIIWSAKPDPDSRASSVSSSKTSKPCFENHCYTSVQFYMA